MLPTLAHETDPTLLAAAREFAATGSKQGVIEIVRHFGRALTDADGVTFILKEGSDCYYADEDAIGPLWKGRRFPQTSCVSGWVMMSGKPAVIEDVFADPRIPVDVYKPTFVRSLAMVPVGERHAIAAIGSYWATIYRATPLQLALLESFARYTATALKRLGQI